VAYLLAVDKSGQSYQSRTPPPLFNSEGNEEEKKNSTSCLTARLQGYQIVHVRSASRPPAGPHVFVDRARELTLLIHPPVCLVVGPVYPNSIFVDDASASFPQMGVWPRLLEEIEGSSGLQEHKRSGNPSRRVKGNLHFSLTVTYHGCPRNSGFLNSRRALLISFVPTAFQRSRKFRAL
jgi:hypothetical protein